MFPFTTMWCGVSARLWRVFVCKDRIRNSRWYSAFFPPWNDTFMPSVRTPSTRLSIVLEFAFHLYGLNRQSLCSVSTAPASETGGERTFKFLHLAHAPLSVGKGNRKHAISLLPLSSSDGSQKRPDLRFCSIAIFLGLIAIIPRRGGVVSE